MPGEEQPEEATELAEAADGGYSRSPTPSGSWTGRSTTERTTEIKDEAQSDGKITALK